MILHFIIIIFISLIVDEFWFDSIIWLPPNPKPRRNLKEDWGGDGGGGNCEYSLQSNSITS